MAAAVSSPATDSTTSSDEHRSFRLSKPMLAVIEDVARGIEEGESGLKSCALGALAAAEAGAKTSEVASRHHHEVAIVEDEDECFNLIGDYLAQGFTFGEVKDIVALGGGSTHLLALERWCERVRLSCNPDLIPATPHAMYAWTSTTLHERRRRCRAAFRSLRATAVGLKHAAILHVVYGWPDPFVRSLGPDVESALGREYGPLARYTDVVEAKRQDLVRAEASRRHRAYVSPVQNEPAGSLAAALAYDGERREALRLAAKHGVEASRNVFDLERQRSLQAWADRVVSSGDALRAATDKEATPEKSEREIFITNVRIEANRMLTEASVAFFEAWRST